MNQIKEFHFNVYTYLWIEFIFFDKSGCVYWCIDVCVFLFVCVFFVWDISCTVIMCDNDAMCMYATYMFVVNDAPDQWMWGGWRSGRKRRRETEREGGREWMADEKLFQTIYILYVVTGDFSHQIHTFPRLPVYFWWRLARHCLFCHLSENLARSKVDRHQEMDMWIVLHRFQFR